MIKQQSATPDRNARAWSAFNVQALSSGVIKAQRKTALSRRRSFKCKQHLNAKRSEVRGEPTRRGHKRITILRVGVKTDANAELRHLAHAAFQEYDTKEAKPVKTHNGQGASACIRVERTRKTQASGRNFTNREYSKNVTDVTLLTSVSTYKCIENKDK
ncbi:hypothetical protein EVAR_78530_1 [Eumeta japonica]|uniref:Uncharacterized protein n=1 Tax=Eumeta variegata TaxID=151549 RepID=A0A4C1W7H2_EUMVA|nr:hypothetical protein EVAR_78530_1 [Eumeta japonica]